MVIIKYGMIACWPLQPASENVSLARIPLSTPLHPCRLDSIPYHPPLQPNINEHLTGLHLQRQQTTNIIPLSIQPSDRSKDFSLAGRDRPIESLKTSCPRLSSAGTGTVTNIIQWKPLCGGSARLSQPTSYLLLRHTHPHRHQYR